jgi:hypothetical protein
MTMAEKLLKLVLYLAGAVCAIGAVALFMPRSWMAIGHEWLGMGEFPGQPVAEYLARETSGMYAFYGVLLLLLAGDVRRYRRIITYQCIAIAFIAVTMLFYGGMPTLWLLGDVASATGTCAVVLILQAVIAAEDRRKATGP